MSARLDCRRRACGCVLLPDALVVPCQAKAHERCGCEHGQQAEPHHRADIVLDSVAGELPQEEICGLGKDRNTNEVYALCLRESA